jgi:SAM-dependent methyltransferase
MSEKSIVRQTAGYCHCCRKDTFFTSYESWLRDHYKCKNCNSIPRQRHLQYILDIYFPNWTDKIIHESSPSNNFIQSLSKLYSSSQYLPGIESGKSHNGITCENLERLSFADNSIDIFITQDVLEHIFNPELAAAEIIRVLKPGGAHVFTAPKHKGLITSRRRAALRDDKIIHLLPEQYHGNPVGDGKSLVTWDYGDDFEFLLYQWAKQPTATYITKINELGIDAEFIEVFVTRKMALNATEINK